MKLHELYLLFIQGFEEFYRSQDGAGMCSFANHLYDLDIISPTDRYALTKDFSIHKPKDAANGLGYWWELGESGLQKRIQFIKERYEQTKNI